MIMGFGAVILTAVFVAAVCLSVFKQQAYAGWVAGAGVLMLAYFALSVVSRDTNSILVLLYRALNIYLFLLLAIVFTVAGNIGLLLRSFRHSGRD